MITFVSSITSAILPDSATILLSSCSLDSRAGNGYSWPMDPVKLSMVSLSTLSGSSKTLKTLQAGMTSLSTSRVTPFQPPLLRLPLFSLSWFLLGLYFS